MVTCALILNLTFELCYLNITAILAIWRARVLFKLDLNIYYLYNEAMLQYSYNFINTL